MKLELTAVEEVEKLLDDAFDDDGAPPDGGTAGAQAEARRLWRVVREHLSGGSGRGKSDCHFRSTATGYARKPGIKRSGCTAK